MITLLVGSLYLVGIAELIFAVYFFITRSGNEIRKVMAVFAAATATWVLSSAFISYADQTVVSDFLIKIVFVSGVFLLTGLLNLVLVYPYRMVDLNRFSYVLLYVPAVIFSAVSLLSNAIVEEFVVNPSIAGVVIPGPLYQIYNAFLLILFFAVLAIIIRRIFQVDGIHRKNLKLLLFGIIIGGTPAVYFSLVEEFLGQSTNNGSLVGNLFTAVWFGVAVYIVLKK